jgi:riboflavin kinase/FMN adenylyltransferase
VTALCIGKFDALHRGHRELVVRAAAFGQPALLGFSGMPEVLGWDRRLPLVAPADRARILATWPGAPREVTLPFAEIRGLDAAAFVQVVRARCGATALVVGEDFRGGRDRAADAHAFAAAGAASGLTVAIVAAVADAAGVLSSTRVRAALNSGDLVTVSALLGRPHRLLGTVVRGDGRGRSIGIPTANLGQRQNQEPGPGVYAAWAWVHGARYAAAVNVGRVPTAGADRELTVEAHLIGFDRDCYGQELALDFVARVRDEKKFADFTALVAQIRSDVAAVPGLLARAGE